MPGERSRPWFSPPTVPLRWRILVTMVLVAGIALTVSGVLVAVLERRNIDLTVTERLRMSRHELILLVEEGIDPATGAPLDDPSTILETHLRRSVNAMDEGQVAFVDGRLKWVASTDVAVRPEEDAELMEQVAPLTTGSDSVIQTMTTTTTTYRVLVVPVSNGVNRGAFVHVVDMELATESFGQTMNMYVVASVITVGLVALLAWFVVSRLLRPITELRIATDAIDESDLTTRVPVHGHDDLTTLAQAVNRMLGRVQRAVKTRNELLDDVGHELRTPITVIRGHMELIDPDDPADVRDTRALVLDEAERMGVMVNDLLELARVSDSLTPAPTDLEGLTEDVFTKVRALGERRWVFEGSADVVVDLDPARITQAWLQLADNAVKYSGAGAVIGLGSAVVGDEARLWVRDEGIGIAGADIERIRGRFERAVAGEGTPSGSGLGLSIVGAIVEGHGGRLDIDSIEGEGSTFTLVIPLHEKSEDAQ